MKKVLSTLIVALFIVTSVTPVVFGYNQQSKDSLMDDEYFDNILFHETLYINDNDDLIPHKVVSSSDYVIDYNLNPVISNLGVANSSWPMSCHDLHHTGQSPYSTASSPDMEEKWSFITNADVAGSPVIGEDGVIYFGDHGYPEYLYAVYPNGTLKWGSTVVEGWIWSAPAIDEDGTIYVSSYDDYLYAINPEDGTRKWRFPSGDSITSSPAIGNDGTVYFGNMANQGRIFAVNPDGSEKWHYDTGGEILSDPAIGDDGTIYIGSRDHYLYAMNPNGTVKWQFLTGDIVKCHPSIADDGTIYVGSFDGNLYAINPNGSEKWRFGNPGSGANSASIASDGTIYVAGSNLWALNPDGSLKWTFDFGSNRYVAHSSPAISSDGTIYVGIYHGQGVGGEIIVVNPDGTEKWRKYIANEWVDSSPCISEDGTVYIGDYSLRILENGNYVPMGYLHAFGPGTPNDPPNIPTIDGPTEGEYGQHYNYVFSAVDPEGSDVRFWIDWGDGEIERWLGPISSGNDLIFSNKWEYEGNFTIAVMAEDDRGEYSDWAYLEVTMPVNQQSHSYPLLELIRERFPIVYDLMMKITGGLRI